MGLPDYDDDNQRANTQKEVTATRDRSRATSFAIYLVRVTDERRLIHR